jgi:hypothetical protein
MLAVGVEIGKLWRVMGRLTSGHDNAIGSFREERVFVFKGRAVKLHYPAKYPAV